MNERVVVPEAWLPTGEAVLHEPEAETVIWGGIPGEAIVARRVRRGRNRVLARAIQPAGKPDPRRRKPPCDRYTPCGGCPLMHIEPAAQAEARLWLVHEAFARQGLEGHTPDRLVPSPDGDENYRHVVKLAVETSDRGHIRVGARGRHNGRVVPIRGCIVATPELRRLMGMAARSVLDLKLYPWTPDRQGGAIRYLVLRQSRATGERLLTVVAGRRDSRFRRLAEDLTGADPGLVGVHLHFNDTRGNAIFNRSADGGVRTLRLAGVRTIEERLGDLRLRVGPGDFYQVNPSMAERIARDLVAAMADHRDKPVLDLYCGVGGFGLALAREHGWALGIEGVAGAVARARENARLNNLRAEFIAGPVLERLSDAAARLEGRAPVVVVDPARRGLEEGVARALHELAPARLAYLSCNPRALARDLAGFVAHGWQIDGVTAYDMFPQTAHIELMALLSPRVPPKVVKRPPRRRVVRE